MMISKLDREERKISLSMKQLLPSPWDEVAMKYMPGTVVEGKVTKIMQFGAFVELEPGIEGLIHISELAPQRVFRATDIVKPEQVVSVKVLNVDKSQKRISLSLKATMAASGIIGRLMYQIFCSQLAPSIAAASCSCSGTDLSAARYMIMKNGEPTHTLTRITQKRAQ